METYVVKNEKDFEKIKDENGYSYKGNLRIECDLNFIGRLYVEGYLYINAGGSIKAGGSIEAGGSYGISAGLSITCKGKLIYGLKCFAGICTWRAIKDDEKTITCGEHNGGVIEYGILKEIGLEKSKTIISRESALSMLKTKYNEDFEIV